MSKLPLLQLKKNEDRRLRSGHLWIYSNEVDMSKTPLADFYIGQCVNVTDSRGHPLGTAYVNPHSLISARVLTRRADTIVDADWLIKRLNRALQLRTMVYDKPFYRVVYGESDGLPGLVIDRYEDTVVLQINTAGMENLLEEILHAIEDVLKPGTLILRNDSAAREQEGLELYTRIVKGNGEGMTRVEENGARFEFSATHGQKTGWFYDHRANRARVQKYAKNKRVLDVFSYVGAWGIEALVAGASELVCVDSSEQALLQLKNNVALNGVDNQVQTLHGEAFDVLKQLIAEKEKFDLVIVDPPAFVKRRKDLKEGSRAYQRLNSMAMRLLKENGLLVSASCSYHMSRDRLLNEIRQAGQHAGRLVQVIEQGHQAPDHPVHPAMPETDYLKAFFCRIV